MTLKWDPTDDFPTPESLAIEEELNRVLARKRCCELCGAVYGLDFEEAVLVPNLSGWILLCPDCDAATMEVI